MKQKRKTFLSLIMLICLTITVLPSTKIYANEIIPCYNYITSSHLNTNVNSNGILNINYSITSHPNFTSKIVITTYFEKRHLGIFWERVNTNSPNNEWVSSIYSSSYQKTRTFSLPETGTYRTTVIYQIYGNDGTVEQVKHQKEVTY